MPFTSCVDLLRRGGIIIAWHPRQRPDDLRDAVLGALGLSLSPEETAILAGRLRFNDDPALSQQTVADRLSRSQPYISNLERELVSKLQRAAKRRYEESAKAAEMHEKFDAVVASVDDFKSVMPRRPIRLKKIAK